MKFKAEIDVMPLDALLDPQGKAVTNSMINIQNSNSNSTQTSVNNELNNSNTNSKDLILTGCSFKTEGFTPQLSTPKPSLLRSRSTRISVTSSASSFFPDEINDVDSDDKTKP